MIKNKRTIQTTMWSLKAKEVLASVLGQLSDGYGKNISFWKKYWQNADIERADDGEVLIVVEAMNWANGNVNPFYSMSDEMVKKWFADKLYWIADLECQDNKNNDEGLEYKWNTTCQTKTARLSYNGEIMFAEAHYIHDQLLGKADLGKSTIDLVEVYGTPRTPDEKAKAAEARVAYEQEQTELKAEYSEIDARKDAKIKELEEQIKMVKDLYCNERKQAYEKRQTKLNELRKQFA